VASRITRPLPRRPSPAFLLATCLAPGSSPLRNRKLSQEFYTPNEFYTPTRLVNALLRYAFASRYIQYPGRRRVCATARMTRTSPRAYHATTYG
jgi:hypothetical protein